MIELSSALLAGILAAQVAQLGFEARLIQRVSTVETKVEERTDPTVDPKRR
jgi:hypothetical protein